MFSLLASETTSARCQTGNLSNSQYNYPIEPTVSTTWMVHDLKTVRGKSEQLQEIWTWPFKQNLESRHMKLWILKQSTLRRFFLISSGTCFDNLVLRNRYPGKQLLHLNNLTSLRILVHDPTKEGKKLRYNMENRYRVQGCYRDSNFIIKSVA